jgi:hypothetical protein
MEEKDIHSELASIRSLMERSSRFLSLSGLSGVLAGIYASIGAFWSYQLVTDKYNSLIISDSYAENPSIYHALYLIATLVLVLSVLTGILLSIREAKKKKEQYWNPVSKRLITNMAIPLASGGIFILILISKADYQYIAAACLLFYGLALTAASQYTFSDVKYLGFCQIILGLLAAWIPESGLLFWIAGFGVLHIIYGAIMHFKYKQ